MTKRTQADKKTIREQSLTDSVNRGVLALADHFAEYVTLLKQTEPRAPSSNTNRI